MRRMKMYYLKSVLKAAVLHIFVTMYVEHNNCQVMFLEKNVNPVSFTFVL